MHLSLGTAVSLGARVRIALAGPATHVPMLLVWILLFSSTGCHYTVGHDPTPDTTLTLTLTPDPHLTSDPHPDPHPTPSTFTRNEPPPDFRRWPRSQPQH